MAYRVILRRGFSPEGSIRVFGRVIPYKDSEFTIDDSRIIRYLRHRYKRRIEIIPLDDTSVENTEKIAEKAAEGKPKIEVKAASKKKITPKGSGSTVKKNTKKKN